MGVDIHYTLFCNIWIYIWVNDMTKKQLLKELDRVDAKLIKKLDYIEKQEQLNKKQSWIKFYWIELSIIGLLLLLVLGFNYYYNSTSYICSKNPNKCVCEKEIQYAGSYDSISGETSLPYKECSKFRKKTQPELDTDDCNNNPREDDLCKCEEYKQYYQSYKNDNDECKNLVLSNKEIVWTCYSCIKSRPKTNYEKHPEDYVAEIIYPQQEEIFYDTRELTSLNTPYIIVNLTNSFYFYHKNSRNYIFDFQEIINDKPYLDRDLILDKIIVRFKDLRINQTTYRLKNECEKGNPNWINEELITCCDGIHPCVIDINNPLCFETKTICREKTNVEKLMDKDCWWLQGETNSIEQKLKWCDMVGISCDEIIINQYLQDLKQAWRQKECKI